MRSVGQAEGRCASVTELAVVQWRGISACRSVPPHLFQRRAVCLGQGTPSHVLFNRELVGGLLAGAHHCRAAQEGSRGWMSPGGKVGWAQLRQRGAYGSQYSMRSQLWQHVPSDRRHAADGTVAAQVAGSAGMSQREPERV